MTKRTNSIVNFLFPAFLVMTVNLAPGQEAFTKDFSKVNAMAGQLLDKYVEQEEVVGLAFTVMHKDKIIYSGGFGKANLELEVPATDATLFRLASVSKLFTAAAIAKLSEEGDLELDSPIEDYVPEFAHKKWKPTIRQVAAHMGGIRGYLAKDFKDEHDIFKEEFPTTDDALKIFVSDSLLFEPGTGYKYSTFGFTLLTAVVENVSGKRFEDYLAEDILYPLNIGKVVPDRPEQVIDHRSGFYDINDDRTIKNAPYIRSDFKFGGGGLLTSSKNLAKFGSAHTGPGFFKASTLNEDLFREQAMINGKSVNIGLAWRVGIDENFGKVYHHSGALPGGRSVLMVWPDYDLILSATSNTTNSPYYAEQFAQVLSHMYLNNINGPNLPDRQFGNITKGLIFSSPKDSEKYFLRLKNSGNSGSMEVPPQVRGELEKRKFPVPDVLPVLGVYTNKNGSNSVILSSDIGLHRLEIQELDSKKANGFIIELSNKYEWEIKKHHFIETKD